MKKELRLKKRAAFTYVYKRGEKTASRHEALQPLVERINPSFLYVIVAHPSASGLGYAEMCAETEKLFRRAGKLAEE